MRNELSLAASERDGAAKFKPCSARGNGNGDVVARPEALNDWKTKSTADPCHHGALPWLGSCEQKVVPGRGLAAGNRGTKIEL